MVVDDGVRGGASRTSGASLESPRRASHTTLARFASAARRPVRRHSPVSGDASPRIANQAGGVTSDGWPALFASAFHQSRNPMVLVDGQRSIVDANAGFVQLLGRTPSALIGHPLFSLLAGGPLATPSEWREALAQGRFTGEATLRHADGSEIAVEWAAAAETATGRRLVLFVALKTSRWGAHFRRPPEGPRGGALSVREREIVHHIALGRSGPEIADELNIAHDTVRTHARNAMSKLGARSRAHLVAKAFGEMLFVEEALLVAAQAPFAHGPLDS